VIAVPEHLTESRLKRPRQALIKMWLSDRLDRAA
jgi:hypothetical protein